MGLGFRGFFPSRIAGNYVHWRGLLGTYMTLQLVSFTVTINSPSLTVQCSFATVIHDFMYVPKFVSAAKFN